MRGRANCHADRGLHRSQGRHSTAGPPYLHKVTPAPYLPTPHSCTKCTPPPRATSPHPHLHKVHPPLVAGRRKARHIADDAATQRQERRAAVHAALQGLVPHHLRTFKDYKVKKLGPVRHSRAIGAIESQFSPCIVV